MSEIKTPKAGEKVTIGFTTNGNGRITKSRVTRTDTIVAVYSDQRKTDKGVDVFSVKLFSGDLVEVVRVNEGWTAIS